MEDMAAATSKSASMAAQSGIKIEQLSAIIGTIESRVKAGGNEVGTSLKTLLMNIQDSSSDKIKNTLDKAGASMTKFVNGSEQLRDPIEILSDLSETYNRLDAADPLKAEILSNIGMKRHSNKLAALLSGWDDYERMLQDYSEGDGSAAVEAEKSANNWQGQMNKLSNNFTDLIGNFVNSDIAKLGLGLTNGLVSGIDGISELLGSGGTIGALKGLYDSFKGQGVLSVKDGKLTSNLNNMFGKTLSGSSNKNKVEKVLSEKDFASVKRVAEMTSKIGGKEGQRQLNGYIAIQKKAKNGFDLMARSCSDVNGSLNVSKMNYDEYSKVVDKANKSQSKLSFGQKATAVGMTALSTAGNTLLSFGVGAAVQGVVSLIDYAVNYSDRLIEKGDVAKKNIANINDEYSNNARLVKTATKSYDDLAKHVDVSNGVIQNKGLNDSDFSSFLSLSNELAKSFPTLVSGYDSQGNAILNLGNSSVDTTTKLNGLLKMQREIANMEIGDNLQDSFVGTKEQVGQVSEEISQLEKKYAQDRKHISDVTESGKNIPTLDSSFSDSEFRINTEIPHAYEMAEKFAQNLSDEVEGSYSSFEIFNRKGIENADGTFDYIVNTAPFSDQEIKNAKDKASTEFASIAQSVSTDANKTLKQIAVKKAERDNLWGQLLPDMRSYAQTNGAFNDLGSTLQKGILNSLSNTNLSSVDDIKDFLDSNIIAPITSATPEVQQAYEQLFENDAKRGEKSLYDWTETRDDAISKILKGTGQDLTKENKNAFAQQYGYIDESGKGKLTQQLDDMESVLGKSKDVRHALKSMSGDDFSAAYDIVMNDADKYRNNIEGVISAINDYKRNNNADYSIDSLKTNLDTAASDFSGIQGSLQASTSPVGMTSENIDSINAAFGHMDGFDYEQMFKRTAKGIQLNRDALAAFTAEQEKNQKQKFKDSISDYERKLIEANDALKDIEDTDSNEFAVQQSQVKNLENDLNTAKELSAQYDGLTSSYNKFVTALSGSEEGTAYDTMASGYQTVKNLFDEGWSGTDKAKTGLDYFWSGDASNLSPKEIESTWDTLQPLLDTWYNVTDSEGEIDPMAGISNFVDDVNGITDGTSALNKELETGTLNLQDLSNAFGISEEAGLDLVGKLQDAGWDINVEGVSQSMDDMVSTAEEAQRVLKSLGIMDTYEWDFQSPELEKSVEQLEKARELVNDSSVRNEDGTYNYDAPGAEEREIVFNSTVRAHQKAQEPSIMGVDPSSGAGGSEDLISSAQTFQKAKDELDFQTERANAGLSNDVEGARENAEAALQTFDEVNKESGIPLDVDTSGLQEAEDGLAKISDTELEQKLGVDTSEAESDIESTGEETEIDAVVKLDQGSIDAIATALNGGEPLEIPATVKPTTDGNSPVNENEIPTAPFSTPEARDESRGYNTDSTPIGVQSLTGASDAVAKNFGIANQEAGKLNQTSENTESVFSGIKEVAEGVGDVFKGSFLGETVQGATPLDEPISNASEKMDELDSKTVNPKIETTIEGEEQVEQTTQRLEEADGKTSKSTLSVDASEAESSISGLETEQTEIPVTVKMDEGQFGTLYQGLTGEPLSLEVQPKLSGESPELTQLTNGSSIEKKVEVSTESGGVQLLDRDLTADDLLPEQLEIARNKYIEAGKPIPLELQPKITGGESPELTQLTDGSPIEKKVEVSTEGGGDQLLSKLTEGDSQKTVIVNEELGEEVTTEPLEPTTQIVNEEKGIEVTTEEIESATQEVQQTVTQPLETDLPPAQQEVERIPSNTATDGIDTSGGTITYDVQFSPDTPPSMKGGSVDYKVNFNPDSPPTMTGGTVSYTVTFNPSSPPAMTGGVVTYTTDFPKSADSVSGKANYKGFFPKSAPPIPGKVNYTGNFPTSAPTLQSTITYYANIIGAPKASGTVSNSRFSTIMNAHAEGTVKSPKIRSSEFHDGYLGKAYADPNNISLKNDETALVNEVGSEIVVRDGKIMVINDGYPTIAPLKSGDIIFNHKQSKELLSKGYLTGSHGKLIGNLKTHASGTIDSGVSAYAEGTDSKWKNSVDWIERMLESLEYIYGAHQDSSELAVSLSKKNAYVDKTIDDNEKLIKANQKGDRYYYDKAVSVGLSKELRDKARVGDIKIEDYDEGTQQKIKDYQEMLLKWHFA